MNPYYDNSLIKYNHRIKNLPLELKKWEENKVKYDKKIVEHHTKLKTYERELKEYNDWIDKEQKEKRLKEFEKLKKEFLI